MIRLHHIVASLAKNPDRPWDEWADEWMAAEHAGRFSVGDREPRVFAILDLPPPDRPAALRKLCRDFEIAIPDEIALAGNQMGLL